VKRSIVAIRGLFVALLLAPIKLWSRVISPALPPRCRYYPTCSAYAEQAIREHGPLRGFGLAVWRIVRCNPFSAGGVDEVPPRRDRHAHPHPPEAA
jgi:putative membrane protein insertion efficiency factor